MSLQGCVIVTNTNFLCEIWCSSAGLDTVFFPSEMLRRVDWQISICVSQSSVQEDCL